MSNTLRIVLFVGALLYLLVVFCLLRKRSLELKYSLLWICTGIAVLVCVISPELIFALTKQLGIEMPVNAIFLLGHLFEVLILMMLTLIASRNKKRIKDLVQQIGLLEKQVRDLEAAGVKRNGEQRGEC